jgi:hypothetical protein
MIRDDAVDRPLRDFGLWLGIVGSPLTWLIQFQTIYMLVYPACGAQRNVVVHATCFVFFLAIAALGIYPWYNWTQNRLAKNPVSRTRRFMSMLGVMTTGLFLLLVIAQWTAAIMLDPCAT